MSYPPPPRLVTEPGPALALIGTHPFAHLFTSHGGLKATRLPFFADTEKRRLVRLRAHLNAQNPQAQDLDGSPVLVVFSGFSTYVSPHWRAEPTRAGTYDYEEVQVRGTVRVVNDFDFFTALVNDLSELIEPQYAEVGDYPIWQTSMAPPGYVERLFPHVTPFVVDVDTVQMVSKLHQQFPVEDRLAIAQHLECADRDDSRAIGKKIREQIRD